MSEAKNSRWASGLLATSAPGWSVLVRLLVGLVVFFPEGIQKLIFSDILGAGRFANIGIPYPGVIGPVCRCRRNDLRRADYNRPLHQARGCSAHHHHGRRNRLNENPDTARARFLDVPCAQARALRLLEHDAPGAGRPRHAAGIDLSADRGRRGVVARCAAHPRARATAAGRKIALRPPPALSLLSFRSAS